MTEDMQDELNDWIMADFRYGNWIARTKTGAATMTEEELLSMQLHQRRRVDPYTTVFRVPGGWIYEVYVPESGSESTCFVPEPKAPNK